MLWCDEIGCMYVGYIEKDSHDVLVWLSDIHKEYADEHSPFYIEYPQAWMPLPRPPMTIIEGEEAAEVTARSADIMNDLEPVLRRIIAEHLTKEQVR